MRRLWARLKGTNPLVVDSVTAGLLTIAGLLGLSARPTADNPAHADIWAYLLVLVGFGALAVRRRYPVTVLAVVTAAASIYVVRDYAENGLPVIALIALYTVASLTPRRQWGAAVAAISVLTLTLFRREDLSAGDLAGNIAIFAIAAVFGDSVRTRRAYTLQLELRAIDLEENQEAQAQRAVAEERLRIARELHDVVAHAMSVVAVQSGVGAHVIDTDPAEAKRILENVKVSSRMALDEMRRLLGVLREEDGGPCRSPLPPVSTAWTNWPRGCGRPACTSPSAWRGRARRCRPAWTSAPTASSRRPSRTCSSTPGRPQWKWPSATTRTRSPWRWRTTGAVRQRRRTGMRPEATD